MRFLITGAKGFVGRWLVRHLVERGDDVAEFDHEDFDVCDAEAVARRVREVVPDAVVHLAAQSSVALSFDDPVETFRTNVLGTVALLEAVRRHAANARVLVTSSAEVYGAVGAEALPIRESTPLAPSSPYGSSKVAQEVLALQYHRSHGLSVVVTRTFSLVGPGQADAFALPAFARQLAATAAGENEPVLRVGNLNAMRDFTDVRDAVQAYALVVERGQAGEVYNVCSGVAVSVGSALDILIAHTRLDVRIEVDTTRLRPVDVPVLIGNNEKLALATGWTPSVPLSDTLADLYEHHRSLASEGKP